MLARMHFLQPVLARIAAATGAEIIASTDVFLSGSYDISPKRPKSPVGTCKWYKLSTLPQPNGELDSILYAYYLCGISLEQSLLSCRH